MSEEIYTRIYFVSDKNTPNVVASLGRPVWIVNGEEGPKFWPHPDKVYDIYIKERK